MYIKIYFNDKPLLLCDLINPEIDAYAHHEDSVFMDEFSPAAVESMIQAMKDEKTYAGVFIHSDVGILRKEFWKHFTLIQAGGGVVQNAKGEWLFMLRRAKWDLPKGKMDQGETLEECAVREVGEETGLKNIRLEQALLITYHTYQEQDKYYLKETHWYRMRSFGDQTLVPQQEEQITELRWITGKEIKTLMTNTYPSIIDVLKSAGLPVK